MPPEACYHYTSRFAAQSIISLGRISVGRSGLIWLTTDDYLTGAEAANRLAIYGREVEVRVKIPLERVQLPSRAQRVKAIVEDGKFVRRGLGVEFTTPKEIEVADLEWESLGIP